MNKRLDVRVLFCTILVVALVAFGCVMVFSASNYVAEQRYGNSFYLFNKQIVGAVVGLAGMIVFSFIDYHKLIKFRWVALVLSLVFLILVFIPGVGVENYGAKRWIGFGGFSFQPSEIAKFVFIFFSAYYLSNNHEKIKTFKGFLPIVLLGSIFCLLVILEPNMSITMCLGVILLVMLFVGGASKKQFALIGVPALLAVPTLIVIEPYRMKRLTAFVDPWATPQAEGFQLIQSLYSLGSGGWFGVGLFCSRQKYLFLPFSESDFIFSIIVEEFGFVGGTALIGLFAILVFSLVRIALSAKDRFGCLLVVGIASVITVQVLLNIAVVTGSIPPTGLPLPFISYGGTSLVVFMSAIGICLNVAKQCHKKFSYNLDFNKTI